MKTLLIGSMILIGTMTIASSHGTSLQKDVGRDQNTPADIHADLLNGRLLGLYPPGEMPIPICQQIEDAWADSYDYVVSDYGLPTMNELSTEEAYHDGLNYANDNSLDPDVHQNAIFATKAMHIMMTICPHFYD